MGFAVPVHWRCTCVSPMPKIEATLPRVRTISLRQPFVWLALGWRDLMQIGTLSLLHGVVLAIGGAAISWVSGQRFWFLAGSLSGFLLVAPVLATSLYALSRAIQKGHVPNFNVVLRTWLNWHDSHIDKWSAPYWSMVQFGCLLALAGTGWVVTSAAFITLLAPQPIATPIDFIRYVVLAPQGWLFEAWLALGAIGSAPVFASSVVSMPLLLDRRVTLLQAVLTSWQTVLTNPVPLALWATLILCLTALGFASLFLGLVVIVPWLGHASWHAYCDLVDTQSLVERVETQG